MLVTDTIAVDHVRVRLWTLVLLDSRNPHLEVPARACALRADTARLSLDLKRNRALTSLCEYQGRRGPSANMSLPLVRRGLPAQTGIVACISYP